MQVDQNENSVSQPPAIVAEQVENNPFKFQIIMSFSGVPHDTDDNRVACESVEVRDVTEGSEDRVEQIRQKYRQSMGFSGAGGVRHIENILNRPHRQSDSQNWRQKMNNNSTFFISYHAQRPSKEEITQYFSAYGVVVRVATPEFKKTAFVTFSSFIDEKPPRSVISSIIKDQQNSELEGRFHIDIARPFRSARTGRNNRTRNNSDGSNNQFNRRPVENKN